MVHPRKSLPTQKFLCQSPFLLAWGHHPTCCPVPEQIRYRSCGPTRNPSSNVGSCWDLLSTTHCIKEEYQTHNKVFQAHPTEKAIAREFTESWARCKIVSTFRERTSFRGMQQLPNGDRAGPSGQSSSAGSEPLLCRRDQSSWHSDIPLPEPFLSRF